jgi:S1-C subfamily serine protease
MYKLFIAVSVALVATFYVGQKISVARHEQERQQKQAEEKLEQEKKRAEPEREAEREREAEKQRALERKEHQRTLEREAQRKLEAQRKPDREAKMKLEAQRKLDEKIAYERKVQQARLEAAQQQQEKDQIIDFDSRLRRVVIDRKKRAKEWRLGLDEDWYRNQRWVGTRGTATDQEAFDRMQKNLYKGYGELSAYEKTTEELDKLSRELNEAISRDDWEEASKLYGVANGRGYTKPNPGGQMEPFRPDRTALENLPGPINRAMRANVLIETRGGLQKSRSLGSGVIMKISEGEALILTNRHVVDTEFVSNPLAAPVDRVYKMVLDVTLVDQRVVPGRVTWIAPFGIDLALVRIQGATPEARAARWKIGRRARVGDRVFAIGNPLGLGWTHTQGTISQFRIKEAGDRAVRIIQTETALNPGNSGGGLYDAEGYLIGINTWARDKRIAEGLNFAISLDALQSIAPPGLILQD